MFIISNVIIIGVIVKFVISKQDEISKSTLISLSLIAGGGVGNLIDRIFRGFVIDYIDINQLIRFPVFNLADVFIIVGILILVLYIIINFKKQKV